jgi:hypothetical protein
VQLNLLGAQALHWVVQNEPLPLSQRPREVVYPHLRHLIEAWLIFESARSMGAQKSKQNVPLIFLLQMAIAGSGYVQAASRGIGSLFVCKKSKNPRPKQKQRRTATDGWCSWVCLWRADDARIAALGCVASSLEKSSLDMATAPPELLRSRTMMTARSSANGTGRAIQDQTITDVAKQEYYGEEALAAAHAKPTLMFSYASPEQLRQAKKEALQLRVQKRLEEQMAKHAPVDPYEGLETASVWVRCITISSEAWALNLTGDIPAVARMLLQLPQLSTHHILMCTHHACRMTPWGQTQGMSQLLQLLSRQLAWSSTKPWLYRLSWAAWARRSSAQPSSCRTASWTAIRSPDHLQGRLLAW